MRRVAFRCYRPALCGQGVLLRVRVKLLVDALLFVAPFALYPKLGAFAAVLNGFIALFYRGLLELSKSFLDPFGNRRVSASGLSADIGIATLIGESNAGSIVWPQGASCLPFRFNKNDSTGGLRGGSPAAAGAHGAAAGAAATRTAEPNSA